MVRARSTDGIRAWARSSAAIDAIMDASRWQRYGQLEIHLHDAQVVKIMRSQQIRLFEDGSEKAHCTNTD